MKDYYALLSVAPDATTDDIKRAFRREIARYHPDKVHHLGEEFQALAAERAAELTEAYRVLMDGALRASYDHERGGSPGPAAPGTATAPTEPPRAEPRTEPAKAAREPQPEAPPPPRKDASKQPPAGDAFVRRMAMTRFRDAIERSLDGVTSMPTPGFEASYLVKGKRSLFAKSVPERMMTAYVGHVTPDEVATLGQQALAARGSAMAVTVFALGDTLAPASEISTTVTALRRKAPKGLLLSVVPVDVRDWTAMMPKDASANARAVIAQLNAKD